MPVNERSILTAIQRLILTRRSDGKSPQPGRLHLASPSGGIAFGAGIFLCGFCSERSGITFYPSMKGAPLRKETRWLANREGALSRLLAY